MRQASPVVVVGGRKLRFDSLSESSEFSDVNFTASRSRPRRYYAAKEQRQPLRGQSPRPEASASSTAVPEGADAKKEGEDLHMKVTVPGRRQEIVKRTSRKAQIPQVYKARQLGGRVGAI